MRKGNMGLRQSRFNFLSFIVVPGIIALVCVGCGGGGSGGANDQTPTVTDTPINEAPVADYQTVTTDTPINEAPAADYQIVTTDEDTSVPIILTGSDPDGDSLTFAVLSEPDHGTLTGNKPALTYTPDLSYYGTDIFTYQTNDGTADSNPATVTIIVTGSPAPEEWKLIKAENDHGNDDWVDSVDYYIYDAIGNISQAVFDFDNDCKVDSVWSCSYDANGNLTRLEADIGNNGTVDSVWVYSYEDGNNTKTEIDSDNDQMMDAVCYYTYDDNSNLTKVEVDFPEYGTIDQRVIYTYDSDSGYVSHAYFDFDYHQYDDSADFVWDYVCDADGNLEEFAIWDSDNNIERRGARTYDYNVSIIWRSPLGYIDDIYKTPYFTTNFRIPKTWTVDRDGDGTDDASGEIIFDDGLPVREEIYEGADPTINEVIEVIYYTWKKM